MYDKKNAPHNINFVKWLKNRKTLSKIAFAKVFLDFFMKLLEELKKIKRETI